MEQILLFALFMICYILYVTGRIELLLGRIMVGLVGMGLGGGLLLQGLLEWFVLYMKEIR